MKKILSLVLALVMVLGLAVPAFAEEDPYTGTTTITANVAKPDVEYEIVIPSAVTMNKAGVVPIGEAKIDITGDKLKYATANTVISYTASGTNFKLSTDESKTMAATYYSAYTDANTNTVLDSTKAIDVYKNSALVNPLTKLYVGVSQTDWDAAAMNAPGTYTATVTYNFTAKEFQPAYIDGFSVMILRTKDGPTNMYNIYTGNKPGKQLTNVAEAVLLKCTAKEITGDNWFAFDDVEINGNEYIMHGNAYSAEPTNLLEQGYIKIESEQQLIEWLGLTYVG